MIKLSLLLILLSSSCCPCHKIRQIPHNFPYEAINGQLKWIELD